jgi:hypothetical protein
MTGHGNMPKLTKENYLVWKQKIRRVLITKTAYNSVTGDELLPGGNCVALRLLYDSWHIQGKKALVQINLGFCDELFPLTDHVIENPVEMWTALRD